MNEIEVILGAVIKALRKEVALSALDDSSDLSGKIDGRIVNAFDRLADRIEAIITLLNIEE